MLFFSVAYTNLIRLYSIINNVVLYIAIRQIEQNLTVCIYAIYAVMMNFQHSWVMKACVLLLVNAPSSSHVFMWMMAEPCYVKS